MRPFFFGQKWVLGFALALIYIPLRTYINVPRQDWHTIPGKLPLFGVEIIISTVFYTSWIYLINWFLKKLSAWTGHEPSFEFRLSNQLITLVPAILLALIFHTLLVITWGPMEELFGQLPRPFIRDPNWHVIRPVRTRGNQSLTIMALIAAYYLCVNNQVQEKLKRTLVDSEKLEKENMRAQFLALKNQISPHFLFNNLSVLASLVESHPEKSAEFIQELSSAYRYILEQSELEKTSLKEEMKFLDTYIYLLRTRFRDKVILNAMLTPADLECYAVIPLTLQLLVENAVKHNTMSQSNPLVITISIENEMLVVSNPLQLRNAGAATTKLGLKNIVSRYQLLQGKQVLIAPAADAFIVKIPLL